MRRHHLSVEPGGAAGFEVFDQVKQCEFRGVWGLVKHGLAAEYAARIDAIEPADEFVLGVPNLDAVGDPRFVKLAIG